MFIPVSGRAKHIQISKGLGVAEHKQPRLCFSFLYHHRPLNKQSTVLILSILKTKVNSPVPEGLLHSVDDGLTLAILILLCWTNKHMPVTRYGGTTESRGIRLNIITLPVMYCDMTGCSNQL